MDDRSKVELLRDKGDLRTKVEMRASVAIVI